MSQQAQLWFPVTELLKQSFSRQSWSWSYKTAFRQPFKEVKIRLLIFETLNLFLFKVSWALANLPGEVSVVCFLCGVCMAVMCLLLKFAAHWHDCFVLLMKQIWRRLLFFSCDRYLLCHLITHWQFSTLRRFTEWSVPKQYFIFISRSLRDIVQSSTTIGISFYDLRRKELLLFEKSYLKVVTDWNCFVWLLSIFYQKWH